MSISSTSPLAAALARQVSENSTNSTKKDSDASKDKTTSKDDTAAKSKAAEKELSDRMTKILKVKQQMGNNVADLLGANSSKAARGINEGSVANAIATALNASDEPNFNARFNRIQNNYIDKINDKVNAYQELAKKDPNLTDLQAELSARKTTLKTLQDKQKTETNNAEILFSIAEQFRALTQAVGAYASADPATKQSGQEQFTAARDTIVRDLALLARTQADIHTQGDRLDELQASFRGKTIGGVNLPNNQSFDKLQVTDISSGTPTGSQITVSDLTKLNAVVSGYSNIVYGMRSALDVKINSAKDNITETEDKIAVTRKKDLGDAYNDIAVAKLQASTALTKLSNAFDNQKLLSEQLSKALTGSQSTRGSVLNLFG